jgi:hypothetical protein
MAQRFSTDVNPMWKLVKTHVLNRHSSGPTPSPPSSSPMTFSRAASNMSAASASTRAGQVHASKLAQSANASQLGSTQSRAITPPPLASAAMAAQPFTQGHTAREPGTPVSVIAITADNSHGKLLQSCLSEACRLSNALVKFFTLEQLDFGSAEILSEFYACDLAIVDLTLRKFQRPMLYQLGIRDSMGNKESIVTILEEVRFGLMKTSVFCSFVFETITSIIQSS